MDEYEEKMKEVKSILSQYVTLSEDMRNIDVPLVENLNEVETAIYALYKETSQITNTIIFLDNIKKYRSLQIFLRPIAEIVFVMAYIDQNPSEANNYDKIQTKGFSLIKEIDFSLYFKDPASQDYFIEILRDTYNKESYMIHPTFASLVENKEPYDTEIALVDLKNVLDLFHLSSKIFRKHFESYLLEENKEKLELCKLETIRIIEPEEFEKDTQNLYQLDDVGIKDKENIERIKEKGYLKKTYPAREEIENQFFNYLENENIQHEEIMDPFQLSYTLQEKLDRCFMDIKNSTEIHDEKLLNFISAFLSDSFKLFETVFYLNCRRNYIESKIVQRIILENTLLIRYLGEYPEECKRWWEYQQIMAESIFSGDGMRKYYTVNPEKFESDILEGYVTIESVFEGGGLKLYREIGFDEFCNYLEENDYEKVKNQITKQNFEGAKFFKPKFLMKSLKEKGIETPEDLYSELSEFVHPNIDHAKKTRLVRNIQEESKMLKSSLQQFEKQIKVLLSEYGQYINEDKKEDLKESLSEI